MRPVLVPSALVLTLALGACASAPNPPPVEDDGSAPLDTGAPEVDAAPTATAAAAATTSDPAAPPADREITATECQLLATRYGDLTRSDAMAALKPGLTAGQRNQAQQNILDAADKLTARWEKGCLESLVGKVANEASLRCAMNAKTVADFDVCLNGPPVDAAPATKP